MTGVSSSLGYMTFPYTIAVLFLLEQLLGTNMLPNIPVVAPSLDKGVPGDRNM